jgi:hypothetical protein
MLAMGPLRQNYFHCSEKYGCAQAKVSKTTLCQTKAVAALHLMVKHLVSWVNQKEVLILLNLHLLTNFFLIICVIKWDVHIKHFFCEPKQDGGLKVKAPLESRRV